MLLFFLPPSLLFHFYHSIHILFISFLIQYFQGGIWYSHFRLINTPLVFFAFCSLLSLVFSPCPSLRGPWPPLSPAGAQVPPAALTPAEGNSGFSWALCWQEKGDRAHSEQSHFLGGLSSQGGWETQELLICLPPTSSRSPATWAPFALPPKGSQFLTVADSSRLSLNLNSDVIISDQSIRLWAWKLHFVNMQKPFCFYFFICFCICWLNASFHQSNETSTAMVSFVLSLAIKPLAGAVYIFICLITTYLLMLNSSYSSLFRRGQEFSFINTHCQNHWTSLAG